MRNQHRLQWIQGFGLWIYSSRRQDNWSPNLLSIKRRIQRERTIMVHLHGPKPTPKIIRRIKFISQCEWAYISESDTYLSRNWKWQWHQYYRCNKYNKCVSIITPILFYGRNHDWILSIWFYKLNKILGGGTFSTLCSWPMSSFGNVTFNNHIFLHTVLINVTPKSKFGTQYLNFTSNINMLLSILLLLDINSYLLITDQR